MWYAYLAEEYAANHDVCIIPNLSLYGSADSHTQILYSNEFRDRNTISSEHTGIPICIVQTHTTAVKAHGKYNSKSHRYSKNVGVLILDTGNTGKFPANFQS